MRTNKQSLSLDRKADVDKILELLQVEKKQISIYCENDGFYRIDGTPQIIKNNEKFEEKNYVEIYFDPEILQLYQVIFHRCKIINFVSLKNQSIKKQIFFSQCIFVENFEIVNSTVKNIKIIQSRFKKNFYLSTSQCKGDIRAIRTHFEGNVDCHSSTFEKNFDLRASEIIGISDFSGCVYKSKVDLLGFKPHIKYKKLQEYISNKQKQYRQEFEQDWEYKNFDFLPPLEIQDTFRLLKDILLKEGNALGASNYHRAELYCKEIELDLKNPPTLSKEWIDKWQLCLYRHTSEHHTDLLKIISWVIITIGIFGVINFGIKYIQDPSVIKKLNPWGITLSLVGSILATPFCILDKKPFFKFGRYFVILLSISTLWIACYKPNLIFGAMNLIDKTTSRSGVENFFLVLYTLVMILLLFSLQKTARKNSIIPI